VVLDAGMSELIRPALYGAFHRIVPVEPRPGPPAPCDLVGPVCESSDVFGRDRMMPPLEPGDLVALLDAGAYGSAMASNYLRRPLPPEVLVDEGRWRYARRRQTMEDMLKLEAEG
jgi:diaminopimelate decarboxylase